jgi:hypothetical protein
VGIQRSFGRHRWIRFLSAATPSLRRGGENYGRGRAVEKTCIYAPETWVCEQTDS